MRVHDSPVLKVDRSKERVVAEGVVEIRLLVAPIGDTAPEYDGLWVDKSRLGVN